MIGLYKILNGLEKVNNALLCSVCHDTRGKPMKLKGNAVKGIFFPPTMHNKQLEIINSVLTCSKELSRIF